MRKVDYGPRARKIIADALQRGDTPEMTCAEAFAEFDKQNPNAVTCRSYKEMREKGVPEEWIASMKDHRKKAALARKKLDKEATLDELHAQISREDVDREDDDEEFEDEFDDDEEFADDDEEDDEDWDDEDDDDEEEDDDDEWDDEDDEFDDDEDI